MGIDDHLAERVVGPHGFFRVGGDVAEQAQHRGNPIGMDAVLRFFQAQDPLRLGVEVDHGQGQESERPIGKGSSRVDCFVRPLDDESQEFSPFIPVDPDLAHVVDQVGEPIGDLRVDSILVRLAAVRCHLALVRQSVQGRGEVRAVGAEAGRRGEFVGLPQGRWFQLEQSPRPHLVPSEEGRGALGRIRRGQDGPGEARGASRGHPAPFPVLMHLDDSLRAFTHGRDERRGPPALDRGMSPVGLVREEEVLGSISNIDMH